MREIYNFFVQMYCAGRFDLLDMKTGAGIFNIHSEDRDRFEILAPFSQVRVTGTGTGYGVELV